MKFKVYSSRIVYYKYSTNLLGVSFRIRNILSEVVQSIIKSPILTTAHGQMDKYGIKCMKIMEKHTLTYFKRSRDDY